MDPEESFKIVEKQEVTPISDIDLRRLSEIYDELDIYLSVYIPTASREKMDITRSYLASRLRAIRKALPKELAQSFESTMDLIGERAEWKPIPGEKGRVIFASEPLGFLHVYRLGVDVDPLIALDTSPFLLPLARLDDYYEDFGILLVDSQEARKYIIRSDIVTMKKGPSIDLMNKHKRGGMSQMRFNRLRRGSIEAFIDMVVEEIRSTDDWRKMRGLVIAGPGDAKKKVRDGLPMDIQKKVIGLIDVEMGISPGDLLKKGKKVAAEDERRGEQAMAEQLREAVLKGLPVAYGAAEVKNALNIGKVRSLLILENISIPGWICERCQFIKERTSPPEKCPNCGGPTSIVDVVEELYELAQRSGAEVEFIKEHAFLESIGGIGALLRY